MGTATSYAFSVHSATGDTVRLVRWEGPPRPLLEQHKEDYLAWRLGEASEAEHQMIRTEVAEYEMPDSFPAYGGAQVAPDGVVWIREFAMPWQSSSRWWGFLPSGEWAWELHLPADFEIAEFGREEILGSAADPLGVERVRKYRLDLPRDSAAGVGVDGSRR